MANHDPTHKPGTKPPIKLQIKRRMTDDQDLLQIQDRLEWTPEERLSYLRDMIAFEQLARSAHRV